MSEIAQSPPRVATDSNAPPAARVESSGARAAVFVGIFALALVTLSPFQDLRAEATDQPVFGRDVSTYFSFLALAIVAATLAHRYAAPAFAAVMRPSLVALAGWMLVSAMESYDPMAAAKRAVLVLLVMTCAAAAPLLPRGRAELARLIGVAVAIPLGLSYFGVVAMPSLAIHSLADTIEPDLAGAWRGVFSHKNITSQVMGYFAFFGFYLVREGRRGQGWAIALGALFFLAFTHGKTSTALWFPALVVGYWGARSHGGFTFKALALGPALLMCGLGVGAQLYTPLADLAASLPFDATFTGRAQVWEFAARELPKVMWTGGGFDSFWDNPAVRYNTENGWATTAAHGHNGYLDATLTMGLVGLALTLWNFVVTPLGDIRRAAGRASPAIVTLCAQIWVYGVWLSSLETFLYDRADPVFFLFLFVVFLLRYLATFPTAP